MALTRQLKVVAHENRDALLKVAFATSDGRSVDQHFGSAKAFAVYGIDFEQAHVLEMAEFGSLAQDGNEDKLVTKLKLLEDCVAVYCRACGASAVRQLLELGIQPIKVAEDTPIKHLVAALREELKMGPSGWLAKAIARNQRVDGNRFDDMEVDGWND